MNKIFDEHENLISKATANVKDNEDLLKDYIH